MTVEELLKPRYKVIADYPDAIAPVGTVFTLTFNNRQKVFQYEYAEYDGMVHKMESFFKEYPHLFRKLEWWEERDIKDMPEYVKDEHGEVWIVYEYANKHASYVLLKKNFRDNERPYGDHSLYELLPATLEEYTAFINQIK